MTHVFDGRLSASALCPVSSTDRVPDSESVDRGSIPLRDTNEGMHPLWRVYFLRKIFLHKFADWAEKDE